MVEGECSTAGSERGGADTHKAMNAGVLTHGQGGENEGGAYDAPLKKGTIYTQHFWSGFSGPEYRAEMRSGKRELYCPTFAGLMHYLSTIYLRRADWT